MRHAKEAREAAKRRFGELASARTVSWELKIPYDTVYAWWREFNGRPITRKLKTTPYKSSDYLKTDEERAMYAEELAKEGGE